MIAVINNIAYEFTRGSDVQRDGMYLEVSVKTSGSLRQLAEVFYSDATGEFSVSCYEQDVPLVVIEELIRLARQSLSPAQVLQSE